MKKEAILRSETLYRGLKAAAKALGCSHEHLSRVLHGTRTANPELKRKLMAMGIIIDKAYPTKEVKR